MKKTAGYSLVGSLAVLQNCVPVLVQVQWESPEGEPMASFGVWDLVGPSGCSSEQRSPSGGLWAACPPCWQLGGSLWHCPGTEHPDTQGSWRGRAGSDRLIAATHRPLRLPSAGQAGGTHLEVLTVWCVPHMSAFPFLSFTESSCEGRGWVCLFFGPLGEELRIEITGKCGLTGTDVAFVYSKLL